MGLINNGCYYKISNVFALKNAKGESVIIASVNKYDKRNGKIIGIGFELQYNNVEINPYANLAAQMYALMKKDNYNTYEDVIEGSLI